MLVVPVAVAIAVDATLTIAVAVAVAVAVRCWQIPNFLDAGIDAFLEQFIQPGAFGLHQVEVGDFRSEGDGELMRRIARQTELFAVIAF